MSGILRHKFRVATKSTLGDVFSDLYRGLGENCGSLLEIKMAEKKAENRYMALQLYFQQYVF